MEEWKNEKMERETSFVAKAVRLQGVLPLNLLDGNLRYETVANNEPPSFN